MMKKAVMYGAGNIGRGFIGQLFSQSGYEVVFLDINREVIDRMNLDHSIPYGW
jgi:mannitol-1-phosphate 5-dehydrogenase